MYKYYLNLKKHKQFALITFSIFSVSISLVLFVAFCIFNEVNYDTFHKDYKNVYRVTAKLIYQNSEESDWARVPPWVGPSIIKDLPEIDAVATFEKPDERIIEIDDKKFKEDKIMNVSASFFDVFGFDLIEGNPATVLIEPNTVVLTADIAQKYFGNKNPINQTFKINGQIFTVTGIVKDGNLNSHFSFNMLTSTPFLNGGWKNHDVMQHRLMFVYTYIRLKSKTNLETFHQNLETFENTYLTEQDLKETGLNDWKILVQPVSKIHLNSQMKRELEDNLQPSTIILLSLITLVLLIVAGLTYIILITSVYSSITSEIGIAQVHGAEKKNIFFRLIGESVLLSFTSMLISFVLLVLETNWIGNIFNNRQLDTTFFYHPLFIVSVLIITLVFGILGGIFPAFRFTLLKKNFNNSFFLWIGGIQTVIAILIIGFNYVIINQLYFFKNTDYGFDKDKLIVIKNIPNEWTKNTPNERTTFESFRNEIMKIPDVLNVAQMMNYPGGFVEESMIRREGSEETIMIPGYDGCEQFIETMGFTITQGRSFIESDDWKSIIVNETAVKKFGWIDNPVGKKIYAVEERGLEIHYTVVGVVKDFIYYSANEKTGPFQIHMRCNRVNHIILNVAADQQNKTLSKVQEIWKNYEPERLFDYVLVKDVFNKKYQKEETLSDLFCIFSIIAILIVILGFYGISSIIAKGKIGIRKVIGANLLTIFISGIISIPLLYNVSIKWLNQYAYHLNIDVFLFIVPVFIILIIAVLSFSIPILKALLIDKKL
jgi:putative ABC transport system permease protein